MDVFTVATVSLTGASMIGATVSLVCALRLRSNVLQKERFLIESRAETKRAQDAAARLKNLLADTEHAMFIDRETFERKQVATYAELAEVRAKLAERIQRASNAGRKARQAQIAMQAARRAETLRELEACAARKVRA
jgi:hypothetical protein